MEVCPNFGHQQPQDSYDALASQKIKAVSETAGNCNMCVATAKEQIVYSCVGFSAMNGENY